MATTRNPSLWQIPSRAFFFPHWRGKKCTGFSLVEILVVIVIIATLTILGAPVVEGMIARSRETRCATNLKQLYTAHILYANDHNGVIPLSYAPAGSPEAPLGAYYSYASAGADFQIYLGGGKFKTYHTGHRQPYLCPADDGKKLRQPGYSYGVNGYLAIKEGLNKIVSWKNPSATFFLADAINSFIYANPTGEAYFERRHKESGNILFLDGHVERRNTSLPSTATRDKDPFWNPAVVN